jgi:hypothetical protein
LIQRIVGRPIFVNCVDVVLGLVVFLMVALGSCSWREQRTEVDVISAQSCNGALRDPLGKSSSATLRV